jgi:hypothetical protein
MPCLPGKADVSDDHWGKRLLEQRLIVDVVFNGADADSAMA